MVRPPGYFRLSSSSRSACSASTMPVVTAPDHREQALVLRLAIDDVLAQKRAAINAHVSQMTDLIDDDPEGFRFTPHSLAPFLRPFEYYLEVQHR